MFGGGRGGGGNYLNGGWQSLQILANRPYHGL